MAEAGKADTFVNRDVEANPLAVGLCPRRLERVTSWLDDQVRDERLAGASVLVGRRGKTAYFGQSGTAEVGSGRDFQRDTIVRLYSMTKPVTSVAAMMLYEAGCFHLDDPIAKYLPEFSEPRVWKGGHASIDSTVSADGPITVRQIFTHTSGLTYGFMRSNAVDARYRELGIEAPGSAANLAEMVGQIAQVPLLCQPGSEWNYSVSTDVLGRLVEVWSGHTLDRFFAEEIFMPLGMVDTGFHVAADKVSRFSALYAPPSGGLLGGVANADLDPTLAKPTGLILQEGSSDSRFLNNAGPLSGGGGLVGTIDDYGRFCQMLLSGGVLNGERLLSPKTVAYMRQNQLPDGKDMAGMGQPVWSESAYDGIGFGLGFAVVIDPIKAHIVASPGEHHWGGAASTFFWLDPQEELYTVFLTQLIPSSTYPIRRELRTRVNQAILD